MEAPEQRLEHVIALSAAPGPAGWSRIAAGQQLAAIHEHALALRLGRIARLSRVPKPGGWTLVAATEQLAAIHSDAGALLAAMRAADAKEAA